MNLSLKPRSPLERLLHEFPWLWAVESCWDETHVKYVRVHTISIDNLYEPLLPTCTLWVVSSADGSHSINSITGDHTNLSLAEAALRGCARSHKIRYLVRVHTNSGGVSKHIIFRSVRGVDLHHLCESRAKLVRQRLTQ